MKIRRFLRLKQMPYTLPYTNALHILKPDMKCRVRITVAFSPSDGNKISLKVHQHYLENKRRNKKRDNRILKVKQMIVSHI